jgi:hypothetical protein
MLNYVNINLNADDVLQKITWSGGLMKAVPLTLFYISCDKRLEAQSNEIPGTESFISNEVCPEIIHVLRILRICNCFRKSPPLFPILHKLKSIHFLAL